MNEPKQKLIDLQMLALLDSLRKSGALNMGESNWYNARRGAIGGLEVAARTPDSSAGDDGAVAVAEDGQLLATGPLPGPGQRTTDGHRVGQQRGPLSEAPHSLARRSVAPPSYGGGTSRRSEPDRGLWLSNGGRR